jgi:hypothetical protein
MACSPLIIWRPIPAGSRFVPKTGGDDSAYNITVFVTHNGQPATPLRHSEIAAGTAAIEFVAGDEYVFDVVLAIVHTPAQNITLDLSVVDANNQVVNVSDGAGGQRPASCSSSFDDPSQSPVMVKVIALA